MCKFYFSWNFSASICKRKDAEYVKIFDCLTGKTILKRAGVPENPKEIVLYLTSDAFAYWTGQNIAIDGGWTVWQKN